MGFEPVKLQHDPIFSTLHILLTFLHLKLTTDFTLGKHKMSVKSLKNIIKVIQFIQRNLDPKSIWYQVFETRKEAYNLEQRVKNLKFRVKVIEFINKH